MYEKSGAVVKGVKYMYSNILMFKQWLKEFLFILFHKARIRPSVYISCSSPVRYGFHKILSAGVRAVGLCGFYDFTDPGSRAGDKFSISVHFNYYTWSVLSCCISLRDKFTLKTTQQNLYREIQHVQRLNHHKDILVVNGPRFKCTLTQVAQSTVWDLLS